MYYYQSNDEGTVVTETLRFLDVVIRAFIRSVYSQLVVFRETTGETVTERFFVFKTSLYTIRNTRETRSARVS